MSKKLYRKEDIEIHHIIAKSKQAYLIAKMGVGSDTNNYQKTLWLLEKFQKLVYDKKNSNDINSIMINTTQKTFEQLAKYYKGLFPGVNLTTVDFKNILKKFEVKFLRKREIRNLAEMTELERKWKKKKITYDYYKKNKVNPRCTLPVFNDGRITLRRDKEEYKQIIRKILKNKLITEKLSWDTIYDGYYYNDHVSITLHFYPKIINGKVIFCEDEPKDIITDVFTKKIYRKEGGKWIEQRQ